MDLIDAHDRLTKLVRKNLNGAELCAYRQIYEDSTEAHFIVCWARPHHSNPEFGTHRALLPQDPSYARPLLQQGHYCGRDGERRSWDSFRERSGLVFA